MKPLRSLLALAMGTLSAPFLLIGALLATAAIWLAEEEIESIIEGKTK